MKPTDQQQQIINAAIQPDTPNLVIEAGAGTGKTSTLRMIGDAKPRERGLYVAYNKAIQLDAEGSFPGNVQCRTAHSLAFRTFGRQFKHRLNGPRINAKQAASILGISRYHEIDGRAIMPKHLARLTMETVGRFCRSTANEITSWHVPDVPGVTTEDGQAEVDALILPLARRAWNDDLTQRDGRLRFEHDMYLKLWQLSGPSLGFDFILFDEAQDADPVILDVIQRQAHSSQLLPVGDRSQAIYGWRGAIDSMSRFGGNRLLLSQSFRFGPHIAEAANTWLDLIDRNHMGTDLRLEGLESINSRVEPLEAPGAVLCRSNARCIAEIVEAHESGRTAALVGGATDIRRMAEAAASLMAGAGCDHPELFTFRTWREVEEFVDEESAGSDLKVFVRIINKHGPEAIMDLADSVVDEEKADVVVSTAHKAKGREWDTVRIAPDFRQPEEGEVPTREEAMLAYVAVTRARHILDDTGLAWVHDLDAAWWRQPSQGHPTKGFDEAPIETDRDFEGRRLEPGPMSSWSPEPWELR